jgi:hypothetical protein
MLNLWWGLTEQTYLYYWHQNVWSVLVAWATVVLVIVLTVLVGAALWRAGTGRRFGPRDLSMHPLVRRSPAPLRSGSGRFAALYARAPIPRSTLRGVSRCSRIHFSSSEQPGLTGCPDKWTLVDCPLSPAGCVAPGVMGTPGRHYFLVWRAPLPKIPGSSRG